MSTNYSSLSGNVGEGPPLFEQKKSKKVKEFNPPLDNKIVEKQKTKDLICFIFLLVNFYFFYIFFIFFFHLFFNRFFFKKLYFFIILISKIKKKKKDFK